MELTREQIEGYKKIDNLFGSHIVHKLCDMLLYEMEKPKVWDGAPDNAIIAKVHFYKREKVYARPDGTPEVYTRELPKSPEREIAEKIGNERAEKVSWNKESTKYMIDSIESAINEYKESMK